MTEPVSGLDALEKATAKLPVARYAWGVVAMVAVIAFVAFTGIGYGYAVLGSIIVFAGMVLMLVLQVADKINHDHLQTPARILVYFILFVFMAVSILLLTSAFANWPLPLKDIMFPRAALPGEAVILPGAHDGTNIIEKKAVPDPKQPEKKPDDSAKIEQLPYKGEPIKTDDGPIEVQKKNEPQSWMPTNNDNKTKPDFQQ